MKLKLQTILTLSLLCGLLHAQKEANIWYFGRNAGLDFNSGSPVFLHNGQLNTLEGCATISDVNGNLLFYTNGVTVWNSNHQVMPNGTGLLGDSSSTQSAIIVPLPGSSTIYYIFTVTELGGTAGLNFSEVDMTLAGGLGDVTGTKNQPLLTPSCEKITAVLHANKTDIWVVAHKWMSNDFHAYQVTPAGVSTQPVVSSSGANINGAPNYTIGCMKVSPDGQWLAIANYGMDQCQLFNFDNNSGAVSNPLTLFTATNQKRPYGVEFSPSSKILYLSEGGGTGRNKLYQYNLMASNIAASEVLIDSTSVANGGNGCLQLGPDRKIYMALALKDSLAVIHFPDSLGLNCTFEENSVDLGGRISIWGLPPFIQSFFVPPPFFYEGICFGDTTEFITHLTVFDSIIWDFGDAATGLDNTSNRLNPKHLYSSKGFHDVQLIVYRNGSIDTTTRKIKIVGPELELGHDTLLCPGETLLLDVDQADASFSWQDGSKTAKFNVSKAGTYWVEVDVDGCKKQDTIKVDYVTFPDNALGNDTNLCAGDTLRLEPGLLNATYTWQDGTDKSSLAVGKSGVYWVDMSVNGCVVRDSVEVNFLAFPEVQLGADTALCEGDIMIIDATLQNATYTWQDGSKGSSYPVTGPGKYWVDVEVAGCSTTDSLIVTYKPRPEVTLMADTILCSGEVITLEAGTEDATYEWQDGSTNSYYDVFKQGVYWTTITVDGCTDSDTVMIRYLPMPEVDFGPDTTICVGKKLTLDASSHFAKYLWQDSSSTAMMEITEPGRYWVVVTVNDYCVAHDTIDVQIERCPKNLKVPNVFTPDGDGINDNFTLIELDGIQKLSTAIYNRWGRQVFVSEDLYPVWDGTSDGQQLAGGVYYWIMKYEDFEGNVYTAKGNITIIR